MAAMHNLSTRPLGGVLFPARIGMDRKFTRSVTSYIFFYYLWYQSINQSIRKDVSGIHVRGFNHYIQTFHTRTSGVPLENRALSWIGHSWSFKVILIGVTRNPERGVVIRYNNIDLIYVTYEDRATGKLQIRWFTTPSQFEDSSPRKAFEYLKGYC